MQDVVNDSGIERRLSRRKLRDTRSQSLGTKLTLEEEEVLEKAATREGKSGSEWAREVLLREARRSEDDPIFTEVVAVRMLLNRVLAHFAQTDKFTLEELTAMSETVRLEKRPEARKLMAQYTAQAPKEQ